MSKHQGSERAVRCSPGRAASEPWVDETELIVESCKGETNPRLSGSFGRPGRAPSTARDPTQGFVSLRPGLYRPALAGPPADIFT